MASEVYFTSDISSEGLLNLYDYCDGFLIDDVAVKMSTGEPPHSNYLRPEVNWRSYTIYWRYNSRM